MPAPYTLTEIHGRRAGLTQSNRIGLLGRFFDVTMAAATDGTNKTKVTFQLVDHEGNSVAAVRTFLITLSDDATNGAGLTATTASGAVAAGASGADIGTLTTKKALMVQTNSSGVYILSITDTAKTAFTVVANLWDHSSLLTLATANYG
jgi:hypothetical protein